MSRWLEPLLTFLESELVPALADGASDLDSITKRETLKREEEPKGELPKSEPPKGGEEKPPAESPREAKIEPPADQKEIPKQKKSK